jgi:hypothetical protein
MTEVGGCGVESRQLKPAVRGHILDAMAHRPADLLSFLYKRKRRSICRRQNVPFRVVAVIIFVVHPLPPGIWMYLPLAASTESTKKSTISGFISLSFCILPLIDYFPRILSAHW